MSTPVVFETPGTSSHIFHEMPSEEKIIGDSSCINSNNVVEKTVSGEGTPGPIEKTKIKNLMKIPQEVPSEGFAQTVSEEYLQHCKEEDNHSVSSFDELNKKRDREEEEEETNKKHKQ